MSVSEPGKIITPWAESGLKNTIPPAANPATGRAGFDQGFSAINMTAKEAGGIPPFGQDFNGIFYEVTNILRYMQAGGRPTYDAALAAAIGGYPSGAVLIGDDGVSVFQNAVDGNATNPNSGGAGWTRPDLQVMELYRRSYAEAGYNLVDGSFEAGGTVTNASDVLLYEAEGKAYSYTGGTFPHTVVAGSNPSAEPGMWTSISAIYLRTIVSPLVIASFKKAGFNVVGSFEVGASTSDKNDAVIKYSTGKAYVRTDGLPFTVISGSTPSTGWTEVTDSVTLSSSVISRTDVSSQADSFFNKTYSPVKIVAHRGFSSIAMENTIWAFQKAKNLGADMLECDIQVSSDGIPLIFHDDTTDRLMSGTGDVLSMTYATMAAMTFTSLAGTAYKNEVIPRFVDMCYWLRSNDIQVLAEFKRLRSIADVQLIINIAKQYEVLDKFVWQCNDTTILVEARKYAPKNKIAFFSDTFIQSRLDELSLMGNAIYMVQYAALNADNTIGGKCHAAGVELATYTNNNSYTLRRLRRDGLQYIITDVNLGRLS